MSLRIPSSQQKFQWLQNWTIFYWAWWVSWAPFVGIFIARVSRGRTIKEFILGVLFVPALVCFIFFAVFGASAMYLQDNKIANIAKEATETATFATLEHYPLGFILSILTLIVIMIFFVTSADSATYVLGMLSSQGDINPSSIVKVSWGIIGFICYHYDLYRWNTSHTKFTDYRSITVFNCHYFNDMVII